MDTLERLDGVLRAAGPAHHAAYIETDGDDPEWPIWYAEHVLEAVRDILGRPDLTLSRLVAAFVAANDEYERTSQRESWHRHYAERFVRDLA